MFQQDYLSRIEKKQPWMCAKWKGYFMLRFNII